MPANAGIFYIKFIGFTSILIRTFAGGRTRDNHNFTNGCKCARASPDIKKRIRYQLRATYIWNIARQVITEFF